MEKKNEILSKNLKRIRRERGLSQRDVALVSKISLAHFSKIERCITCPSLETLNKMARGLNISVCELLKDPDKPRKEKDGLSSQLGILSNKLATAPLAIKARALSELKSLYRLWEKEIQDTEECLEPEEFNIMYLITKTRVQITGENLCISYGLGGIDLSTREIIIAINDISVDHAAMLSLFKEVNDGHISPIHLADVVDDFIENDYQI